MNRRGLFRPCVRGSLILITCLPCFPQSPADYFETHVRPLFVRQCVGCHASSAMGGLQLDSAAHLMKGGKDGAVVVPGDPDKSLLIQTVRRSHERIKMPPQ